jgi:hypothetical protein
MKTKRVELEWTKRKPRKLGFYLIRSFANYRPFMIEVDISESKSPWPEAYWFLGPIPELPTEPRKGRK